MAQTQFFISDVTNAQIPAEGPKAIPFKMNFTGQPSFSFDLTQIQQRGKFSVMQTLFVDNSANAVVVTTTFEVSGQILITPAFSQGYYAVIAPTNTKFVVSAPGATTVNVQFINVPIAPCVWSSVTAGPIITPGGALIVSDAALDAAIINNRLQVTNGIAITGDAVRTEFGGSQWFNLATAVAGPTSIIVTGAAESWFATHIYVTLSADATFAVAANLTVTLLDNATTIFTRTVPLPAAIIAGIHPIILFNMQDCQLNGKVVNNDLRIQLSAALATGTVNVNVAGGLTAVVS